MSTDLWTPYRWRQICSVGLGMHPSSMCGHHTRVDPPRKNTITALGHFTSWLLECVVFGAIHAITNLQTTPLGMPSR